MKETSIGLEDLIRYFDRDAFAKDLGIEIIEASTGQATARLMIKENHLNGLKRVHGGVIFTLADMAFAAAVHSRGRVGVAINCIISYIKAAHGNILYAKALEASSNHKLATYIVNVTDETEQVLAVFQGMAYLKEERLGSTRKVHNGS